MEKYGNASFLKTPLRDVHEVQPHLPALLLGSVNHRNYSADVADFLMLVLFS